MNAGEAERRRVGCSSAITQARIGDVASRRHMKLTNVGGIAGCTFGLWDLLNVASDLDRMSHMRVQVQAARADQVVRHDFRQRIGTIAR
jgi:hypothetical protein